MQGATVTMPIAEMDELRNKLKTLEDENKKLKKAKIAGRLSIQQRGDTEFVQGWNMVGEPIIKDELLVDDELFEKLQQVMDTLLALSQKIENHEGVEKLLRYINSNSFYESNFVTQIVKGIEKSFELKFKK